MSGATKTAKTSTTSSAEKNRIEIQTHGDAANKLAGVLKYLLEAVGAEVQIIDPNDSIGKHFRDACKNHVDLSGTTVEISGLVRTQAYGKKS